MNDALQPLPSDHPFAQRKTVQQLQRQEGEIVKLDPANFGIRSAAAGQVLLPVNLPADLQREGTKILFSGSVKEIGMSEMLAGQPIVLTQAEKH